VVTFWESSTVQSNASITVAEGGDEYAVTTRPFVIQRKPGPEIACPPEPPASAKKGWLPDLNPREGGQRHVPVTTEWKIILMKDDFFVSNFDQAVFVNGAHIWIASRFAAYDNGVLSNSAPSDSVAATTTSRRLAPRVPCSASLIRITLSNARVSVTSVLDSIPSSLILVVGFRTRQSPRQMCETNPALSG
jgi:hypothetical protein